jgi:glycosyltransferase involved in cell wall biosynthesis
VLAEDWAARPPDVVYCHGWAYGLGAQLAAKRHPLPTVQALPGLRRRGAVGRLETLLVRSATRVTVACDEDLDAVVTMNRGRTGAGVLPAGVDCDDVAMVDIAGSRGRGARRIVAVAQDFSPEQGLPQVVQALSAVPGAELTLATPAGADDPRLAAALELAHRVDLGARVAVHRIADRGDLCALLRGADVAVFPAHRDPVGSMVLHAMACGVAVIAAAAGAPRDIVVDDVTGMLVRPGDAGRLSRALRTVLAQSALRHGMGLAARSRVRSRYGWDRIAIDAELVLTAAAGAAPVAAAATAH